MTKLLIVLIAFTASFTIAQEGSYSYYNYFHDESILQGLITDGFFFGGPFRVNGSIILRSNSPGRDNDPYFYSLTLSSDYYYYESSSGPQLSVPHYENLWIEPYEMMEQGAPWFNLGADELAFGAAEVDWQIARTSAIDDGLYLTSTEVPDGSRILIEDGQLTVKPGEYSQPVVYNLSTLSEKVVWIENATTDNIFLKGHPDSQGFSEELTIGTMGNIYFAGPLEYNGGTAGMLGLISVYGDGVIADTPNQDWEAPFQIETEESFVYSASILLLEGELLAENYTEPTPKVDFRLYGGIQMQQEGYTGTAASGFDLIFEYDERLFNQSPPCYPQYETSSVESTNSLPFEFEMAASCNPIHTSVSLAFSEPGYLTIYDSSGRIVESTGVNGEWIWNSSSLPPGIYVLHTSGEGGATSSMKLVKL